MTSVFCAVGAEHGVRGEGGTEGGVDGGHVVSAFSLVGEGSETYPCTSPNVLGVYHSFWEHLVPVSSPKVVPSLGTGDDSLRNSSVPISCSLCQKPFSPSLLSYPPQDPSTSSLSQTLPASSALSSSTSPSPAVSPIHFCMEN